MKSRYELFLSIFMTGLLLKKGEAALTAKPSTCEVVIGDRVTFNCSTSLNESEIHWFHYPINSNPQRELVYGFGRISPHYPKFRIEKDNNRRALNLVIPSVTLNDAGKFECQDEFGRGERKNAELIILGGSQVCQSSIDINKVVGANNCGIKPDKLVFSCIVQYVGNEGPVMKWRKLGSTESIQGDSPMNQGNTTISNIVIAGESVENQSSYECFASRGVSTNSSCQLGNITVISKTVTCEQDSSIAVPFGAIVILLIVGTTLAIALYLKSFRGKKLRPEGVAIEKYEKDIDVIFCTLCIPLIGSAIALFWYLWKYKPKLNRMQAEKLWIENEAIQLLTNEDCGVRLRKENEVLKGRVSDLEKEVHGLKKQVFSKEMSKYKRNPDLDHKTMTQKAKNPIRGITILDDELFAAFEKNQNIEVYDATTHKQKQPLAADGLNDPLDLTSCETNKCLYIIEYSIARGETEVLRMEALKIDSRGTLITRWKVKCQNARLSTHESKVILCISEPPKIIEYSSDGEVLIEFSLPVGYLWHAIKVKRDQDLNYLIGKKDEDNSPHSLCEIDREKSIRAESAKSDKKPLNTPICLAEDSDQFIFVSDLMNSRILLFSTDLKYSKDIVQMQEKYYVCRICLNEDNSFLFVAVNKKDKSGNLHSGRILVYRIR